MDYLSKQKGKNFNMVSLISLPTKILARVVAQLPSKEDIANIRLTSRFFNDIATPKLFSTVPLYAHWRSESSDGEEVSDFSENEDVYDARQFKNILNDEKLSKYVRKVDVYTCEPHCVSCVELYQVHSLIMRPGPPPKRRKSSRLPGFPGGRICRCLVGMLSWAS